LGSSFDTNVKKDSPGYERTTNSKTQQSAHLFAQGVRKGRGNNDGLAERKLFDYGEVMNPINILIGFGTTIFALGIFVANALIAIGVFRDATRRKNAGKRVMVLSPVSWSLVCLFTSLAGLALYLAAHYSTFSRIEN
jgi:hypothetical protein